MSGARAVQDPNRTAAFGSVIGRPSTSTCLSAGKLYNLKDDLGEAKNLVSTNPERLRKLSARMKIEHDRREDQYPADGENQRARTTPLAMRAKSGRVTQARWRGA